MQTWLDLILADGFPVLLNFHPFLGCQEREKDGWRLCKGSYSTCWLWCTLLLVYMLLSGVLLAVQMNVFPYLCFHSAFPFLMFSVSSSLTLPFECSVSVL